MALQISLFFSIHLEFPHTRSLTGILPNLPVATNIPFSLPRPRGINLNCSARNLFHEVGRIELLSCKRKLVELCSNAITLKFSSLCIHNTNDGGRWQFGVCLLSELLPVALSFALLNERFLLYTYTG